MPENQPVNGGWRRKTGYAAAFIGGAALAISTIYFGQQTSREPIVIEMHLDSDQIPDLAVKSHIFDNGGIPYRIVWGEKDDFYLGQPGGGFRPLSKVEKEEYKNLGSKQEERRKAFEEKMKKSAKQSPNQG